MDYEVLENWEDFTEENLPNFSRKDEEEEDKEDKVDKITDAKLLEEWEDFTLKCIPKFSRKVEEEEDKEDKVDSCRIPKDFNKKNVPNISEMEEKHKEDKVDVHPIYEYKNLRWKDFDTYFEVEQLSETPEQFVFAISNLNGDDSLLRELRNILHNEVPTIAIGEVNIIKNTSNVEDEQLIESIRLVPILNVNSKFFDDFAETQVRKEKNTVVFKLKVFCEADKRVFVSSDHLIHSHGTGNLVRTCPIPKKEVFIARLKPGQEIALEAVAFEGYGKNWSPVKNVSYKKFPVIRLRKDIKDDGSLKDECPTNVFDVDAHGRIIVKRPESCVRCMLCTSKHRGSISVACANDRFVVTIDTYGDNGKYSPKDLFRKAVTHLEHRCRVA